jgi:hypothetical protein
MARGAKNYAALLPQVPEKPLAAGSFFVVRCSGDAIDPAYVAWYLNLPQTQHYFTQNSGRGVHMPVVRKSVLEELDMPVPPLAIQRRIAGLYRLELEEQELTQALLAKRALLLQAAGLKAGRKRDPMTDQQKRDAIFNKVWQACDTFRGVIDPAQYKDYILTMLFVKYLSDVRKSKLAEYEKKYAGKPNAAARIQRDMERERFAVAEDCTFDFLFQHRNDTDIGQTINTVLEKIEDANKTKLHNVFRNIDFNSEANLGQARQRNSRLKKLLEDFNGLDLRPEQVGTWTSSGMSMNT